MTTDYIICIHILLARTVTCQMNRNRIKFITSIIVKGKSVLCFSSTKKPTIISTTMLRKDPSLADSFCSCVIAGHKIF